MPPALPEYQKTGKLDARPRSSFASLDSIKFPIDRMSKGFYRALKLRAVYIDVPVEDFRLPDFPANSSLQTQAELDYLFQLQQTRTDAMIDSARAIAGVSFNPFIHYSDSNYNYYRKNLFFIGRSMGEWFNERNLPKTADLIANVWQDQLYYMWSFKIKFNRARPNAMDKRIRNLEQTMWPAYPSGHATFAYTNAFLLMELLPEQSKTFYADAVQCARSREILGVHFPSDSEAGRILARQLIDRMKKSKKFLNDLSAAKEELTAVLTR
jgi:acid phosphatase (class A)